MKKNLALCMSAAVIGAISVGLIGLSGSIDHPTLYGTATGDDGYVLQINKGVSVTSETGSVASVAGTSLDFGFYLYTGGGNDGFGTLDEGGSFWNKSAIHSLKSITVTLVSGDFDIYTGWMDDDAGYVKYASSVAGYGYGEGEHVIDLSGVLPSYFKLYAKAETVIASIKLNYDCEVVTSNQSLTVKTDAPIVGTDEEVADYNYVWVNVNFEGDYQNYRMVKDGSGNWSYTFENIPVDTEWNYWYRLVLGTEDAPDWDYQAASSHGVNIYEGQTEFVMDQETFSGQPEEVLYDTFKLNITVNITGGTPRDFGNIQIPYWNGSSSVWNEMKSTEYKTTYVFESAEMSTRKTPEFEVYIWDNADIHITPEGDGTWFKVFPTGKSAIEYVTVEFEYPVAGGNYTGTFTHQNLSGMYFPSQTVDVLKTQIVLDPIFTGTDEGFTYSFAGTDIRIDEKDLLIAGLKAGTTTKVTLNSKNNSKTSFFFVIVPESNYVESYDALEISSTKVSTTEQWWTENAADPVAGLTNDFWNGVDVSSSYALYQNGAHFYNDSGVEESLFVLLKNAGVNYCRIRLWVDPNTSGDASYGGGHNDIDTALWIAKEASSVGMKILLDLHYSDFWADPTHQALPKAWSGLTGSSLLSKVTEYTTETINQFKTAGYTPDMVQLGNEISSGVLKQCLNGEDSVTDGVPSYHESLSDYSSGITTAQFVHAASEGVKAVSNSIKCVVHWTQGGGGVSASSINSFFSDIGSSDYDYAGLSIYPYDCFDKMSDAETLFSGISVGKPWLVAETSYPFSGSGYAGSLTAFSIGNSNKGKKNIANVSGYEFTGPGQAKMIHDLTSAVVNGGGKGMFYWEPAWTPNAHVGWAAEGSKCTWSNQGLFSFDGKALPNLGLFNQMLGS